MGTFLAGLLMAVKGKAAMLAGGTAVSLGMAAAVRWGPGMLGNLFGKQLDRMLSLENTDDKELAVAVVKWVEKKIPDAGQGRERFALAAKKISSMFPPLANQEENLAKFIENAVAAMDAEAKKRE